MNKSTNHYNTIAKGACNPAEGLTLPLWLLDAIGSNTTKHGAHVRHHCRDPDRELPGVLQFCLTISQQPALKVVRNALFEYVLNSVKIL
jgi:hypothetical protein